jgi:hypothetical protein
MKVSDVAPNYDYTTYRTVPIEGTEDFQEVVSIGFGGGYDWDDLEAWYSPSKRKFFWLEGAGCSCNSLGDDVRSLADFSVGNRDELASAVRAKYDSLSSPGQNRASALLADLATVKTFKPVRLDARQEEE